MVYLILLAILFSAIIGICFAYVSYFTVYKTEKKKEFEKIKTDVDKAVKLIYDNAIKSIIEKHNYKLEECEIKYEMIAPNKVLVKIRPIEEVVEYTLDITIE